MKKLLLSLFLVFTLGLTITSCRDTKKDAEEVTEEAVEAVEEAADDAADTAISGNRTRTARVLGL